ncbi:MAG: carbohydrate ABC transporter permease [Microbacteriaceae bacterium]|nr:carbohydrate ABC transporter permease [Microbacteriaceae bacterium]
MRRLAAFAKHVLLLLWSALVVVPFVLICLLAFRSEKDIYNYPLGLGGSFTLENFAIAWWGPGGDTGVGIFLANSASVALTALATNLAFGAPSAYFITLLSGKVRRRLIRVFLVATVVPLVLLVVPYFQLFDFMGGLNNPFALGFAYGSVALPTTVLILTAFFSDFPHELREAASLDGLTAFGTFIRVVLPLSKGALVGTSLLALIFVWGESQLAVPLLQDPTAQTVPVGLLAFRGQFQGQLGPIFAGLSLAAVPIIIVYLIFNRFIAKGIALGGVFR